MVQYLSDSVEVTVVACVFFAGYTRVHSPGFTDGASCANMMLAEVDEIAVPSIPWSVVVIAVGANHYDMHHAMHMVHYMYTYPDELHCCHPQST